MRNGTECLASNESGIDAPDYMAAGKPSQKSVLLRALIICDLTATALYLFSLSWLSARLASAKRTRAVRELLLRCNPTGAR